MGDREGQGFEDRRWLGSDKALGLGRFPGDTERAADGDVTVRQVELAGFDCWLNRDQTSRMAAPARAAPRLGSAVSPRMNPMLW